MKTPSKFPQPRRLLPTTKSLAAFEAVARLKSFTQAALELSLSQSAVSKQISALEHQLGLKLFEGKRTHGVALTNAGARYFEDVRRILTDLSSSTASIMASNDESRTLRLGVPASFGSRWLIPRIGTFYERHPDITLDYATRFGARLQPNFGNLDAAFEFAPEPDTSDTWRQLMPWNLTLVASGRLLEEFHIRDLADLAHVSILLHAPDVDLWSDWSAAVSDDARAIRTIVFETYPMVFQAAIAGLGVAVAPKALIQRELANGELVRVFDLTLHSTHNCYLVYPGDRGERTALKRFEDWLFSESTDL